jgi:transcriptional regulator with XRE-family HTH domain
MNYGRLLGANIRKLRRTRGWSQERLAEISGLHRTYVSGVERGIRNPTLSIVVQFADALKVVPAVLLSGSLDGRK